MNDDIDSMMRAYWPRTSDFKGDTVAYYKACAEHLCAHAEAQGVVLRVDRQSREPLAMGNHIPVVTAWGHKP